MAAGRRGLILSLAIMAGLMAVLLASRGWVQASGLWGLGMVEVVMVAALVASSWVWWRGLDEAAREAHKFAWWWGGSAALLVAGLLLIFLVKTRDVSRLPMPDGHTDAAAYVVAGALGVMLLEVVGYGLAWLGWWMHRR
ncbi:MAG: hypothetical protein JWP73_2107 [Phenylobacterium sp.]|nr:hypothetical protein [Phenylobacterium sp.]